MLTEEDLNILRSIPLIDVMSCNGYIPARILKSGRAKYLCPFHHETEPSFFVDITVRTKKEGLGWECYGKCAKAGFGAIALQAALLGYDHTKELTPEQFKKVVGKLVDDHDVQLTSQEGKQLTLHKTQAIPPRPVEFDIAQWSAQHFRALGFEVKLATAPGENGELYVRYDTAAYTPTPDAENTDNASSEPLYHCSIDRDYFRGKGEARTLEQWGDILSQQFAIYPVQTFITSPVPAEHGGKVSLQVSARPSYPIFAFTYPWGVKEYEPKAKADKWHWHQQDGQLSTRIYGNATAVAAFASDGTGDWINEAIQDKRHPIVITKQDPDKTPVAARLARLVLCSGPRDAMHVWAHTDAHVIFLHNETVGITDGVLNEWLCATIAKMAKIAVECYVCYDIDQAGEAASAAIALENISFRWLRLPAEMKTVPATTLTRTNHNYGATAIRAGIDHSHTMNGANNGGFTPCKDVTDYITHFASIQRLFPPDLRHNSPVTALTRIMQNSLTMQFWIDKPTSKKAPDGERETNVRYVLAVANLLQFLDAKGIKCIIDKRGNRAFYQLFHDHTYRYLDNSRSANQLEAAARTAMLEWIDAHTDDFPFKQNLTNTIFTGKGLDARTFATMAATPINEHSWASNFDFFFFENTAVKVTPDNIETVAYSEMEFLTNRECILPGNFTTIPQPWHIELNPDYEHELQRHRELSDQCTTTEMRAAENTRWTRWASLWKYRLVMEKPLEEMPLHFRFLYNLGRIFWEKESFGQQLSPAERQIQDVHFINKAHAIGYAITRHRTRARQQIVHLTDYSVADEKKASGRNGKSAVIDMLASVRPASANVAGKSINGSNLTLAVLLGDVVAGVHSVVGVDELPEGFAATELYNAPVSLVCKTLYKQPVTLRDEEVPKLFIASNQQFDRSAGSTKGRIYPCYTSDYYHAATDDGRFLDFAPKDEFLQTYGVAEVANGLPPQLLNQLRNMLIACAQFFLQHPDDTIIPPANMRRELYAMAGDAALIDWLMKYFDEQPDNPHFNQPIPPQEMAIALLDYEQTPVTADAIEKAKRRIAKNLKALTKRLGVVMDPPAILDQPSYRRHGGRYARAWITQLDNAGKPLCYERKNEWRKMVSTGIRLPRVLSTHTFCHYFFRNRPGEVPTAPDNIAPAAPTDPEAKEKGGSDATTEK